MLGTSFARLFSYLGIAVGPALLIAFAFPTGFFETSLPLMIKDLGMTTSQSGIIFSAGTFAIIIAQVVFVERLMKRFGELTDIVIGMVAAVIFYLIIPFSNGF